MSHVPLATMAASRGLHSREISLFDHVGYSWYILQAWIMAISNKKGLDIKLFQNVLACILDMYTDHKYASQYSSETMQLPHLEKEIKYSVMAEL